MDSIIKILGYIPEATPAEVCQAYYVLAIVAILTASLLPKDLRSTLIDYGARQTGDGDRKQGGLLEWVISCARVPHSWFLHFYVLSVASSAFWAWQYLTRGSVMEWLAREQLRLGGKTGMTIEQVYLAWALMATQGSRRLYESFFVTKPGSSPMASIHWLVGLAFYTDMGVSVWIEGSGAILDSWDQGWTVGRISPWVPAAAGMVLFFIGWFKQGECHKYLASLKKYTLPEQGWFKHIVSAHYTSECLIYLGLSVATAPSDGLFNRTMALGLAFVVVNLGMTAHSTKKWYAQKFGADRVAGKWRMIPFVF